MIKPMLLTDLWKKQMSETLQMVYGNKLKQEQLDNMLNGIVDKSMEKGERRMFFRDVYRNTVSSLDLNKVLKWVTEKDLIIGANGSYTFSPQSRMGDASIMIMHDLDARAKEKALEKKFETEGNLKEAALHGTLQLKHKEDTNSAYGIACQNGSFFFNPDSASLITSQSRQLISEVLWSFEKLLGNNLQLTSYNEALLYFNLILNEDRNFSDYKGSISYVPTRKDIEKYICSKLTDIPEYYSKTMKISRSLFIFIESLSEEDRIYIYYKNNLKELLGRNPKIMNLFKKILDTDVEFLNPNRVPKEIIPICNGLINVIKEFCYTKVMTRNRVDKYFASERDVGLLSDTDSVYVILHNLKKMIYNICGNQYINKNNDFKIINTLCTVCTDYMIMRHDEFIKNCNARWCFDNYKLEAKNEFYYKRIILYSGVKKNYSGLKLLREGNILPEAKQISHTGIKLTSSKIPKQISEFQTNLLENRILRSEIIDPVAITMDIQNQEKLIIAGIKNGDKSLGVPVRFSGLNKYKNFQSVQICRLVEIWNRLYPDNQITDGEYMMSFETKLYNESNLYMISDLEMRDKIKNLIFCEKYNGEANYIKTHGMRTVGIPRDGDIYKLPTWMIEIIDYDVMARKHLQAIVDLLPSLNMPKTRVKANDTRYSPLVKFN